MEKESSKLQMVLRPIGWVRSEVKKTGMRQWDEVVSEVILEPEFVEAADGLEEFSHIVVLFWMHKIAPEERSLTKTHPQRRMDMPLLGVLATRAPARPNPIGLRVVRLLERKGNTLRVKGLDAIDGTPVIDIKPYISHDAVGQITVPDWVNKL